MSEIYVNSYIEGKWQLMKQKNSLVSPIDGSKLSQVTQSDICSKEILTFSRKEGMESLQELNFHQRAKIIKQIVVLLDKNKDALYNLSYLTGATLNDSYLDIDGIGTLHVLAQKSEKKWENFIDIDGGTEILSRNGTF